MHRDQRGNELRLGHVVELTCDQRLVSGRVLSAGSTFVVLAFGGVDRLTLGDRRSGVPVAFEIHSRRVVFATHDERTATEDARDAG